MFKNILARWRPAVTPLAIGLVVIYGAFYYSSSAIRDRERAVDLETGHCLSDELVGSIEQVRTVMGGIQALWASSSVVTDDEFLSYAHLVMPSSVGLVGIGRVGENGIVRVLHTDSPVLAKSVGMDLNNLPQRGAAMSQARQMDVVTQTGPVVLSNGEPGLIILSPLKTADRSSGFAAGLVSMPETLATIASELERRGYTGFLRTEGFIMTMDGKRLFTEDGRLYLGSDGQTSPDVQAPPFIQDSVVIPMMVGSRPWELVIHRRGSATASSSYLYAILSTLAVTMLVAMAIVLRRRNASLQEALAREREFVSIVSHQLREPLTQLSWSCDTLLEDETIPEAKRCQMLGMHDIVRRAVRLTSDLLNVSRLERGVLHLEVEDIPVATLIDDVMSVIKEAAERRKINFKMNIPGGLCVLADRVKAAEAIRNIVDNAIKYSPEGSAIEMVSVANRGEVQLAIADHGPGIPEAIRSSFFDRSSATVRRSAGTGAGLGMYLSKMFLERMGGRVSFKTGDQGTTFMVTLPMASGK
jgi:signal transduction histidine kinase